MADYDHVGDEISFSTSFPLPYRVLVLGAVGVLGWATNLHGLTLLGIDAASARTQSSRVRTIAARQHCELPEYDEWPQRCDNHRGGPDVPA